MQALMGALMGATRPAGIKAKAHTLNTKALH